MWLNLAGQQPKTGGAFLAGRRRSEDQDPDHRRYRKL